MPAKISEPAWIFARNVVRLRKEREMSQQELAWACCLHQTAIARIEEAERQPRFETIIKLARGLDVDPAELFAGISLRTEAQRSDSASR